MAVRSADRDGGAEVAHEPDTSAATREEVALRLDPALTSVAAARSAVADLATRTGVPPEVAEDGMLVVSELVTNAVLHARTPLDVRVEADGGSLRVEVGDRSEEPVVAAETAASPAPQAEVFDEPVRTDLDAVIDALATTGRGMALVGALASSWGVSQPPGGGKVVWAVLDPVPAGPSTAPAGGAPGADRPSAEQVVRLVAVPVRLIVESDQIFDDTLRELQVLAMSGAAPPDLAELSGRAAGLRDALRAVRLVGQEEVRRAIDRGDRLVDVHLPVGSDVEGQLDALGRLLADTAAARRSGQLLVLGPSREVVSFRRWFGDEVRRQLAGGHLRPCPFPVVRAGTPLADAEPLSERRHGLLDRLRADLDEAASPDPAATLTAVAAAAVRRVAGDTGASFVNLLLVEPDGAHVAVADRIGYAPDDVHGRRYAVTDDNPISEVVRTGRPLVLRTPEERRDRYPELIPSGPIAANPTAVWVPLGRVAPAAGTLVVGFPRARDFTDADLEFLVQVGLLLCERLPGP